MKLGTQTASVINHLHARGVVGEPVPKVGMGATVLGWSDRHPVTIVSVDTKPRGTAYSCIIEVIQDYCRIISGNTQNGSSKFEFMPNSNGHKSIYRKNAKTGMWESAYKSKATNRLIKGGCGLRIGERERYVDPNF